MSSAILEDPAVRRQVFPVSVEFYHQAGALGMLGEDVELLDGIIVKKMPKSPLHEGIVRRLVRLLQSLAPAGCYVVKDGPITCARSEPEPDVAVIRGDEDDLRTHPTTALLVIEVAVTTEERDRRKAAIYAEAGVQEYWLVEPEGRRLTVFRQPQGAAYAEAREHAPEETASSAVVPGFSCSLAELLKP
jgi:Uma2 family endonuclease